MKCDQPSFVSAPPSNPNTGNRLLVLSDLVDFKLELLAGIRLLLKEFSGKPGKRWLKSYEVRKLLDMSPGTLQTLRNNRVLPFTKIGGVVYYDIEEINKILSSHK